MPFLFFNIHYLYLRFEKETSNNKAYILERKVELEYTFEIASYVLRQLIELSNCCFLLIFFSLSLKT